MDESRIVAELFLEKPRYEEIAKASKSLESAGIKSMMLPPENRGVPTHIVVELSDAKRAEDVLSRLGIPAKTKEVLLIPLENKPGTMADMTKKVSSTSVNLTYAFCIAVSSKRSYMLLDSADNAAILEILKK